MNTYGGMVVYADSLRSMILNSRKPVWVFIDNNAASAGALISIACDRIYMREGANIGAATVVNQTGEAMPDKYQSYMRSMIRSTAEAQGRDTLVQGRDTVYRWKRNPHIAEAMVDQSIYIQGITDSGRVVTFTAREAMKYGFCDGMAESVDEVLKKEQVENYTIRSYHPTVTDRIIGFLINPVIQGLLIMVIVGGIYFELQTPGIGFPLAAALTACLLYFAPLYLEGFARVLGDHCFCRGSRLVASGNFCDSGLRCSRYFRNCIDYSGLGFCRDRSFLFSFPGRFCTSAGSFPVSGGECFFGIFVDEHVVGG